MDFSDASIPLSFVLSRPFPLPLTLLYHTAPSFDPSDLPSISWLARHPLGAAVLSFFCLCSSVRSPVPSMWLPPFFHHVLLCMTPLVPSQRGEQSPSNNKILPLSHISHFLPSSKSGGGGGFAAHFASAAKSPSESTMNVGVVPEGSMSAIWLTPVRTRRVEVPPVRDQADGWERVRREETERGGTGERNGPVLPN